VPSAFECAKSEQQRELSYRTEDQKTESGNLSAYSSERLRDPTVACHFDTIPVRDSLTDAPTLQTLSRP